MPTTILDNETYPEALQRRYAEETKAEKQAEIIRMAREACSPHQVLNTDLVFLERFAALVAAHEREACAKVCDEWNWSSKHGAHPSSQLAAVAAAIRARGDHA